MFWLVITPPSHNGSTHDPCWQLRYLGVLRPLARIAGVTIGVVAPLAEKGAAVLVSRLNLEAAGARTL